MTGFVALGLLMLLVNVFFLVLLVKGISKLLLSRASKKISVGVVAVYLLLLMTSPLMAVVVQGTEQAEEPVQVPEAYWEQLLEKMDVMTLEELLSEEHLVLLDMTEISISLEENTSEGPLMISSSYRDHDQFYRMYQYQVVVEASPDVEAIEIHQFVQRAYTNHVEISQKLMPWTWTAENGSLTPAIQQTDIVQYRVSPNPLFFHFEKQNSLRGEGNTSQHTVGYHAIPEFRMVQWIRVPEKLYYQVL